MITAMNKPRLTIEQWQQWTSRLLNEDGATRLDAARAMLREGFPLLRHLMPWAESSNGRNREMFCYLLGAQDYSGDVLGRAVYPDGIPILIDLLQHDPNANVREQAASSIGDQQSVIGIPALIRSARDHDAEVRYGVTTALGSYGDSVWEDHPEWKCRVQASLLGLMDDEDDDVRDWATFGVHQGDHDTPESRARLWKALDDPNPDVSGEAASGLAKFGDRTLIPKLELLLKNETVLSSLYFESAAVLGDPSLLPAVLAAAERWHSWHDENEKLSDRTVNSAVKDLTEIAEKQKQLGSLIPGLEQA